MPLAKDTLTKMNVSQILTINPILNQGGKNFTQKNFYVGFSMYETSSKHVRQYHAFAIRLFYIKIE